MKRYASHYLFLPPYNYLKQYVVEVADGQAVRVFPLTEEIEDVEWFPGVIALLPEGENGEFVPYLYYPFDFATMKPVGGTRRRLLP
ncbi:MAG: hypothetical protein Q4D56_00545 [Bacteroides sp.]|nr:hypothetical protein [Bacteroides sp.]